MPPPNLTESPETSPPAIEINDADAITVLDALNLARELSFPIGKSTLQRWAIHWRETPGGAVRCVLVTTAGGKIYKLHRDDFEAWVLDQQRNRRSRETFQDLMRSHEVLRDPERPRETSDEAEEKSNRIKELENENMQLKIDVGVRKQLLERAKEEMEDLRSTTHNLLRENGSLEFQLRQLAAPAPRREVEPPAAPVDNSTETNEGLGI